MPSTCKQAVRFSTAVWPSSWQAGSVLANTLVLANTQVLASTSCCHGTVVVLDCSVAGLWAVAGH